MTDAERLAYYIRVVEGLIANDKLAATYPSLNAYRRGVLKMLKAMDPRDERKAA